MSETPVSMTVTIFPSSQGNYLEALRREMSLRSGLDLASRELAVSEVAQHIDFLKESLEVSGCPDEELESRAVSLMDHPARLAEAFASADNSAKHSCPQRWRMGNIQAWVRFLQLQATAVLAAVVSTFVMLAAVILAASIPQDWQEPLIVPSVAAALFSFTVLASRLMPVGTERFGKWKLLVSAVAFSLGAHLATFSAESISKLQSPFAQPAAYFALLAVLSLFTAVSFSGIFFDRATSRDRYFRITFCAVLGVCLVLTMVIGFLPGSHRGLLFCLYTAFGMTTVLAVRHYVRLSDLDNLNQGVYAR